MRTRATFFGHPIHQMLIVFPMGLLPTSFAFDVVYMITDRAQWLDISFWLLLAGIISGLIAAVFGFIDWTGIPKGTRARSVGTAHAIGNVLMLSLFAASLYLRMEAPTYWQFLLSGLAVALGVVTGWLGGELVDRLGVGVEEGAHLNAPNSLTGRPASERS